MPDRRAQPRKSIVCRIEVEVLSEGEMRRQPGVLEDWSIGGAGISVTKPIAVGSQVRLRQKGWEAAGTVRQCRKEGFGYFVGIQAETTMPAIVKKMKRR